MSRIPRTAKARSRYRRRPSRRCATTAAATSSGSSSRCWGWRCRRCSCSRGSRRGCGRSPPASRAGHFYPTLVVYLALLSVLLFVVQLPLSYYVGYVREHAYGLSTQRFEVGRRPGQGAGMGVLIGARGVVGPISAAGAQPAALVAMDRRAGAAVLRADAAGDAGLHRAAVQQVRPDAGQGAGERGAGGRRQAGVEGARVFEVDKSVDTKKVNAYVTGVGRTKRIVLWDTLLARLSPRQTRFVVGHELGHYVLGHVWTSILVSSGLTVVGLFGVHARRACCSRFGERFGFTRSRTSASMPLFMLLLSLFSLVHHAGDAGALALPRTGGRPVRAGPAHDNQAAATAFVALQQQNLAVPRPGPLQDLPRQPPAHRRAGRLHQRLPPLGQRGWRPKA